MSALACLTLATVACSGGTKNGAGGGVVDVGEAGIPDAGPLPECQLACSAGADASASAEAGSSDAGVASACPACDGCVQEIPVTSANHVEGNIVYPDPPPVGGDHNPCWLNFGIYRTEQPDERWVHNLEHGGVAFLYHCPDGCPAEVAALERFAVGKEQMLVMPYREMHSKFAAVSWGYRVLTDCLDLDLYADFYRNHVDHGPESIKTGPPAAYCPQ
jgi:hypothetical protein